MKTLVIPNSIQKGNPHSENLVLTLRNTFNAISSAYSKFQQRATERALADAVVEQHYRETKQKAFELMMGIRSDQWKGH